jgi:hypothetical protein
VNHISEFIELWLGEAVDVRLLIFFKATLSQITPDVYTCSLRR